MDRSGGARRSEEGATEEIGRGSDELDGPAAKCLRVRAVEPLAGLVAGCAVIGQRCGGGGTAAECGCGAALNGTGAPGGFCWAQAANWV